VASAGLAGFSLHYYYTHVQETPVTGRRRFVAFTREQFDKISQEARDQELADHGAAVLPTDHPAYQAVVRVAGRLLSANRHLAGVRDKRWAITVVDEETENAYVLPCGSIFVFTGMLEFCANEDQLGCVLGHEMAHAVLGHGAERISRAHLLDLLMILPLAAIWALLPNDGISAFAHWFFRQTVALLGELPHSRDTETEADLIGLQMAARACFDVREAEAFWAKMAVQREVRDEPMVGWLSTHPEDDHRRARILEQLPALHKTMTECQCGPLPARDPRAQVEEFRRRLLEQAAELEAAPKAVVLTVPSAAPESTARSAGG